jgi:thioredoxin reductase (NADPH)
MKPDPYDVLVVGGGPVGLYAGYRASLLGLTAHVVDKGRKWGRAFHVPRYPNLPMNGGRSGRELIDGLRRRIKDRPGCTIDDFVRVDGVERKDGILRLDGIHHPSGSPRSYASRAVMLATGVVDRQPIIGGDIRNIFPHANKGLMCYCEICDGFLADGKEVAVVGAGDMALHLALDLANFGARTVSILTHGKSLLEGDEDTAENRELVRDLRDNGLVISEEEIASVFGAEEGFFGVRLAGGRELRYAMAFSAMGMYHINNDLAVQMGGQTDAQGYVVVDEECRVLDHDGLAIEGLYAIGDINYNWNQVMIGFGDADRAVIHAWSKYL